MKLPATVLSAVLLGVGLQLTQSACTKKDPEVTVPKQEQKQPETPKPDDSCPACGMG